MSHPEKLGKYRITEVLGEGAMGVVYKGYDPDIRRVVALKTIRRQLDDGSAQGVSVAARFRNEAQAAGRLSHPGIVAVYDLGEDQGIAFIAMEYVEGQSLAHFARSGVRFSDADIPGLMSQLLDALEHAHQQRVWHRDIKPANIILARAGQLKVADFGIARIEDSGLTQTAMMIGTPSYMAPEQFLGQPIDQRVDIYGAGVLLYVLLTGRPPFTGTQESIMYQVVHEKPKPPSQIDGATRPNFYDALIDTAMAKSPAARFQSAGAFKQALVDAVGGPIDTTAWERTIIAVSAPRPAPGPAATPAGLRSTTSGSGSLAGASASGLAPTTLDSNLLTQAEASLARHVGPLASVLVRRAARGCTDLATLYARLAEHVEHPAARTAFLDQATASGAITGTGAGAGGRTLHPASSGGTSVPGVAPGEPLTAPVIEQATRLLAQRIGPIAAVVVRKAAAHAPQRAGFFALLAEAVDNPGQRAQLLAELARLR